MVKSITRNAFSIFIVFLAYFIPAKLGFIALPPDNAPPQWPASGMRRRRYFWIQNVTRFF